MSRDFRGMKNGVKDSGPGPLKQPRGKKGKKAKGKKKRPTPPPPRSPIRTAMGAPDDIGDHEFR